MGRFTIVLSRNPDGGRYSVTVPAMPGAITEADSREQAVTAVAEIMALWMEVSAEHGDHPLEETPELIAAQVASVIQDRDAEGWERTFETMSVQPAVPVASGEPAIGVQRAGS